MNKPSIAIISFLVVGLIAFTGSLDQAKPSPDEIVKNLLAGISSTALGNGRPKYQTIPFNEDWSQVAQVEESDSLDPLKYIKLNSDSTLWVSLGGELRGRVEAWSNSGFGDSSENDDIFYRHRLRLHADLHAGKNIRIFAEGINALTESRDLPGGRRTGDVDAADLLNLFIDIHVPLASGIDFTFRAGRQDLLSGVQRVLSSGRWGNTIKAWDGFSGILSHKDWKVHSFWTQFVQGDKYGFNEPDENHRFYGFYGTVKSYLDFYWLADEKDVVDDDRHTIGARIHGALADTGYDYDIETAYQFGHRGAGDVSAFMFSALAGRRFSSHAGRPRVWVAFDYASGDDDPNDADIGTYSKVFATGHKWFGYNDIIGRQNIIDLSLGINLSPGQKVQLNIDNHLFWRASNTDAAYNPGGGVIRAGNSGIKKQIGSELDITLKYKFNLHLAAQLGWGHFFAGDFIKESGPHEDIDFAYTQLQFTF